LTGKAEDQLLFSPNMSYAVVEEQVRKEALKDAPRRAKELRERLEAADVCRDTSDLQHRDELHREFRYLERLVTTLPPGSHDSLKADVANLRGCLSTATQEEHRSSPGKGASSSIAEAGGGSHLDSQGYVQALASFLQPNLPSTESQDAVRLLAAEGEIAHKLASFPCVTFQDGQSFSLRTWTSLDDETAAQREHVAILALHQAAENMCEVQQLINQHVQDQGHALDTAEEQVRNAERNIQHVTKILADTHETGIKNVRRFVGPTLGLATLGLGVLTGPIGCAVAKGLAIGILSQAGTEGIARWHSRALQVLEKDIPNLSSRISETQASDMTELGLQAERRLAAAVSCTEWNTQKLRLTKYKPSEVRSKGYAYAAEFSTQLKPYHAFQIIQRLGFSGSLDPSCKIVWSRPLLDQTSLRYLVFSNWFFTREFFCICRSGRVKQDAGSTGLSATDKESYVFAVSSLPERCLDSTYTSDATYGCIHLCGVYVEGCPGSEESKVCVLADIDPRPPRTFPQWTVDRDVRKHVQYTADLLMAEFMLADRAAQTFCVVEEKGNTGSANVLGRVFNTKSEAQAYFYSLTWGSTAILIGPEGEELAFRGSADTSRDNLFTWWQSRRRMCEEPQDAP